MDDTELSAAFQENCSFSNTKIQLASVDNDNCNIVL